MNNKNKSDNHNNQLKENRERERKIPWIAFYEAEKIGTTAQAHITTTTSLRVSEIEKDWVWWIENDDKRENAVVVR